MRAIRRYILVLAVGLVGTIVPAASVAHAAPTPTFTVNSTADLPDANPGNGTCATSGGVCTLRAAIQEANEDSGSTTITLPAGTYAISSTAPGSYGGTSKALHIGSSVAIVGADAATTIIRGTPGHGVFAVGHFLRLTPAISASISGVTITGGGGNYGAGVVVHGDTNLAITDSIITGNATSATPAPLFLDIGGGGIYAFSQAGKPSNITLTGVTISLNSGSQGGGIVNEYPNNITIVNSTIANNVATGPYGGGIRTTGFMTLTNTNVTGNRAGLNNTSGAPGGGGVYAGGGSSASTFTMTGGSFVGNSAPMNLLSSGGALLNATNGTATLNNVLVSGNSAFHGGGILNEEGTLILNQSEVRANKAHFGGGIYNNDFKPTDGNASSAFIRRSTVSGNTATDVACPTHLIPIGVFCGGGGGIFNENSSLEITNSTFADNTASTFGGGVYSLKIGTDIRIASTVRLFNATVAGNFANRDGGGVLLNGGTFSSKNSIVADNFYALGRSDCLVVPASASTLTSSGHNISTDTRCLFTQGTDRSGPTHSPNLLPLALNAPGSTRSMIPSIGSNAIGNGDNAACAAAFVSGVDQRGVSRPNGTNCDIGAVEGEAAMPAATNVARPATSLNSVFSFRTNQTSGPPSTVFMYGSPTDVPLICDFNGDGTRSPTIVRITGGSLIWFERQNNTAGGVDRTFLFGAATDTPVCGDWDGNGTDSPGILRNVGGTRRWFQSNQPNGSGPLTMFYFGAASDIPTFGDWDGDGDDTPGITRPVGGSMLWAYSNINADGPAVGQFYFGSNTDKPVVGNWDGIGGDSPGIVRPEGAQLRWYTRNTIVNGPATGGFLFGTAGNRAFVWTGKGVAGL